MPRSPGDFNTTKHPHHEDFVILAANNTIQYGTFPGIPVSSLIRTCQGWSIGQHSLSDPAPLA